MNRFFVVLWGATAVFLAAAIGFALVTVRLRVRNLRKQARWTALEMQWEPAILDVLSGVEEPVHLHGLVRPEDRLYFLAFLRRYALRLAGEERNLVRELAQPYLPELVDLVSNGPPEGRARAVRTLAELGIHEYAPAIAPALDDPSPLVAMVAARSLFVAELPEYMEPVLSRLSRFELWSSAYLSSMLAAGGEPAVPRLREVFSRPDIEPHLRAAAAEALTERHDIGAATVAATVLQSEEHPDVVAAALRLISRLGHPEHLVHVRPWVDTPEDGVRVAAIRALGALGDAGDRAILTDHMQDPSTWVALQAARGLLQSGGRGELERFAQEQGPGAVVALQVLAE